MMSKQTGGRHPLYRDRPIEPNPARFDTAVRVNDFVLMTEAFSNVYLLQSPEGNIQVNAGMGIEAPAIKHNFDVYTQAPLRYLVLTQGHVDHVGGVEYFRQHNPGLQVIAQAGNIAHQAYDGRLAAFRANRSAFAFTDKFAAAFAHYAQHGQSEFPQQDVPQPDILVEERYELTLGDLALEIIAVPGAETNDSLIIWLPQHRICLTGNLFGCPFGHFPNLVTIRGDRYRDALTVAAAVQTVMDLGADTILYGHHGPVVGGELIAAELVALRDAIHFVHDATVEGMNAGKSLHELMQEVQLPSEMEVGQGYGKVSWGVRAIWENYAGWFKHESTTELYSQPASAVYGDLVELAGGPQAIVERARQKLAQGEVVQALHLLDVLSPVQAELPAAREVATAVHEGLLRDSENFWLSA
ncbi:MAG: MBL fold metallo-hydrolase, partial [Halioglobus sp.]|nr:MBL fold metallo-hydrolase [Halioglobus sp.]